MKAFQTIDELEAYLLKHGESIVDLMGGEIDRIEMKLRVSSYSTMHPHQNYIFFHLFCQQKKFPQMRHCDLEIL